MKFAELGRGTQLLLVAGILLLIDSFLDWQQISVAGITGLQQAASASIESAVARLKAATALRPTAGSASVASDARSTASFFMASS